MTVDRILKSTATINRNSIAAAAAAAAAEASSFVRMETLFRWVFNAFLSNFFSFQFSYE